MQAGALRHPIAIETRSTTVDSYGEQSHSWTRFASAFAEVVPLTGRELVNAQSFRPDVTTRIRTRWVPNVTSAMRVAYGSRVLEIVGVINVDERDREMILICSEGRTQG